MRKSIWLTCLCVLIIGITEGVSYPGEPAPVKANIPSSEMLHAYLMTRVRQSLDRRDAAYETLKTPAQIKAYQSRMRQFFFDQVGELPPRTPLHARVVGQLTQDGYRVEKVLFESQPHFFVTALLYLPDCKPPYPGVLVPCGHSAMVRHATFTSARRFSSQRTAWPHSATTRSIRGNDISFLTKAASR